VKFEENNIKYFQAHCFWEGIPTDIEFTVERLQGLAKNRFRLRAPGYGVMGDYGNGSLYVFGLGLTSEQIKEFDKHADRLDQK